MVRIERQTWDQVMIKKDFGCFRGLVSFKIKFHWAFWRPVEAIGGKIYFGRYAEYDADEMKIVIPEEKSREVGG